MVSSEISKLSLGMKEEETNSSRDVIYEAKKMRLLSEKDGYSYHSFGLEKLKVHLLFDRLTRPKFK